MANLNLASITSLALADAVNPCAIAILTIVLVSILIQNPAKRQRVLTAGLSFIAAVFIGYLIYGLVLIQIFKTFQESVTEFSQTVYYGLAIFAMILGALNIKDYFKYRPGGIMTEMPISMRPTMKLWVKKIVSPGGAFIIGLFVTIFLLPCTLGPYIVASGLLAKIGVLKAIPWLLYYNTLFILPMIAIVGLVYFGFKEVDEISGWKERNIKRLHLTAGILLFLVGFGLLVGWL